MYVNNHQITIQFTVEGMTFVYFRSGKLNNLHTAYINSTFVIKIIINYKIEKNESIKKNENARLFRFSRSSECGN